jgi:DNA-binding protein HU-beta
MGLHAIKQELVDAVAARTGDSHGATGEAIDAGLWAIAHALTAGAAMQLLGFGAFSTGQRAARTFDADGRDVHPRQG